MLATFFQVLFLFRRQSAQTNAATFFVNPSHPGGHDVTNLNGFVEVFNVTIAQPTDVNEPTAIGSQFNEDAKVHDADHNANHFVSRTERFERRHGFQNRWHIAIGGRFSEGITEPIDHLVGAMSADLPFLDALVNFFLRGTRPNDTFSNRRRFAG